MPNPAFWTPRYLHETGKALSIHCATCRELRDVDLLPLVVARPDQAIGEMRFRCQRCGSPGTALVSWRSNRNQPCSYDVATGEKRGDW